MPERSPATRTELAVLGLLAWRGESSGYDLHKVAAQSVGYIWAPARSQFYAVLKRLDREGLVESHRVTQTDRPDKRIFRVTDTGMDVLRDWLDRVEPIEPEDRDGVLLKVFFSVFGDPEAGRRQLLDYRKRVKDRLTTYTAIERTFDDEHGAGAIGRLQSLRLGIALMRATLRWADQALEELAPSRRSKIVRRRL